AVLRHGGCCVLCIFFFFSSRRRHTRCYRDWSSDVCSSDLFFLISLAVGVTIVTPTASEMRKKAASEASSFSSVARATNPAPSARSEERRVGKEGRNEGGR